MAVVRYNRTYNLIERKSDEPDPFIYKDRRGQRGSSIGWKNFCACPVKGKARGAGFERRSRAGVKFPD